jgi:hypothetical protein
VAMVLDLETDNDRLRDDNVRLRSRQRDGRH